MIAVALAVTIALAQQDAPAATHAPPAIPPPDCARLLTSNPPQPVVQLCEAEDRMRRAAALPADAKERMQYWREAAELYARSAQLLVDPMHRMYALDAVAQPEMRKATAAPAGSVERSRLLRAAADERAAASFRLPHEKIFAYDAIARIYGSQNLNRTSDAEQALRQIIALSPGSTVPILRLARVQEEQKAFDAAEATLQGARQQHPDNGDLLKALSAFYGRLARPASGGA